MSSFAQGLIRGQVVINPQSYPRESFCHHVAGLLCLSCGGGGRSRWAGLGTLVQAGRGHQRPGNPRSESHFSKRPPEGRTATPHLCVRWSDPHPMGKADQNQDTVTPMAGQPWQLRQAGPRVDLKTGGVAGSGRGGLLWPHSPLTPLRAPGSSGAWKQLAGAGGSLGRAGRPRVATAPQMQRM